jgi:hypothetical protein
MMFIAKVAVAVIAIGVVSAVMLYFIEGDGGGKL